MPQLHSTVVRYSLSLLLLALTIFLGYFVERANFPAFISAYGLFFAAYLWLITRRGWTVSDRRWWIGLGIVLRVVLLFNVPNLSDDFYRFLWDGRLSAQGIHPFAHPPVYFIKNQLQLVGITPELFALLNSPDYYTVYPPVCQGVFWLAAKLFPESIFGGMLVLKLFLFLCELGVIWVLGSTPPPSPPPKGRGACPHPELKIARDEAPLPMGGGDGGGVTARVIYALNPLILIEIVGNLHFEGAMLCFLLVGILFLQKQRLAPAAVFWALATASKLVPLLFLPIVWAQLGFWKGLRFLLFFTGFTALLFAPLLSLEILENMAGSLNLYFRQFAFNASFYYILKTIGKALADPTVDVGRTLGPILGLVVFVGVWVIAGMTWRRRGVALRPPESGQGGRIWGMGQGGPKAPPKSDQGGRIWGMDQGGRKATPLHTAATLYLLLATTVHPWYIALPFGLGLLTNWRYPIVWTGVAALSYSHYQGGGFKENYWWIALEYTLLFGFMIREYLSFLKHRARAPVAQVKE